MIIVYTVALLVGFIAVVAWVVAAVGATSPFNWTDPAQRFGDRGRRLVGAVLGFGLGGMSASYAGWSSTLSLLAALAGGGLLVVFGDVLGTGDPEP